MRSLSRQHYDRVGAREWRNAFCMPYSTIEPIRDVLTSSLQGETLEVDKRWVRLMTQQIQIAEVEIVADLGTTRVTLEDILNMKTGDIIPLNVPEIVSAKVDGTPIMECKYGVFNGQYALRVEKLLNSSVQEVAQGENHG